MVSSFKVLTPVAHLIRYVVPVRNMATKAVKGKMNFNSKHLAAGEPMPPLTDKLRVHNMRFCPYAQRTILALIAKDIDCEIVNIDLVNKPDWFLARSAFGKVPALETTDGDLIYESLVTVEYLDEVYPQRPLLPKDPVLRAYDKIIIEAANSITSFFFKIVRFPDTVTEEHVASYHKTLQFIQDQLVKRGTKFLDGAQPGYGDYMIWPWFERILMVDFDDRVKIDAQKFKPLVEYLNNMLKDPVVSQYLVPQDIINKFMEPYRKGDMKNIKYDLLLEN